MRTILSGIVTGFRVNQGKGEDFATLDILQVGTKDLESSLTIVYVNDIEHIEYLLTNYSNGMLKWIDTHIYATMQGREKIWVLKEIFNLSSESMEVLR